MANNRMYLHCPVCNKNCLLAKHFGNDFAPADELVSRLQAFLGQHTTCAGGPLELDDDLEMGSHLELRFEEAKDPAKEVP